MMRWFVAAALMLQVHVDAGTQQVTRERYQRVISERYPGFRILEAKDFEADLRDAIRDGRVGALVVGQFNFDRYTDFAALIIPSATNRYTSGNRSYDYYAGQRVICFGAVDGEQFRCEAAERIITLPHDTTLDRIAPGRHLCHEEHGDKTITTRIDSVGEGSEKASAFEVRNRDGRVHTCLTAD